MAFRLRSLLGGVELGLDDVIRRLGFRCRAGAVGSCRLGFRLGARLLIYGLRGLVEGLLEALLSRLNPADVVFLQRVPESLQLVLDVQLLGCRYLVARLRHESLDRV